jgi:hypothetical protein
LIICPCSPHQTCINPFFIAIIKDPRQANYGEKFVHLIILEAESPNSPAPVLVRLLPTWLHNLMTDGNGRRSCGS